MAEREAKPEVVGPGEGHLLTARGSVMAFKAVAAQTGGDARYCGWDSGSSPCPRA